MKNLSAVRSGRLFSCPESPGMYAIKSFINRFQDLFIETYIQEKKLSQTHPESESGKNPITGTVFRRSTGSYLVRTGSGDWVTCTISNKLRKELVYPLADPSSRRQSVDKVEKIQVTDPVAIGDEVVFIDAGDTSGMIVAIMPRRNVLSRHSTRSRKLEQVIVANVDQVVIVSQAERAKVYWPLMDCYIADAEACELPALICITKMDVADPDLMDVARIYEKIGYPVIYTSVIDGTGMEEFTGAIRDKISVFVGKSGVGKSSLLNAIQPGLDLKTREISDKTKKGKHATTHLEMFPLDIGGSVVDTPGMRKINLWDEESVDIAWLYREMRPFLGECRFRAGCTHTHEPGCEVKAAVERGDISQMRYESYLKMIG